MSSPMSGSSLVWGGGASWCPPRRGVSDQVFDQLAELLELRSGAARLEPVAPLVGLLDGEVVGVVLAPLGEVGGAGLPETLEGVDGVVHGVLRAGEPGVGGGSPDLDAVHLGDALGGLPAEHLPVVLGHTAVLVVDLDGGVVLLALALLAVALGQVVLVLVLLGSGRRGLGQRGELVDEHGGRRVEPVVADGLDHSVDQLLHVLGARLAAAGGLGHLDGLAGAGGPVDHGLDGEAVLRRPLAGGAVDAHGLVGDADAQVGVHGSRYSLVVLSVLVVYTTSHERASPFAGRFARRPVRGLADTSLAHTGRPRRLLSTRLMRPAVAVRSPLVRAPRSRTAGPRRPLRRQRARRAGHGSLLPCATGAADWSRARRSAG